MHRKGCFTKLGASSTISVGSGRLLVTKGELNKKKNDPVVPKASICVYIHILYFYLRSAFFECPFLPLHGLFCVAKFSSDRTDPGILQILKFRAPLDRHCS